MKARAAITPEAAIAAIKFDLLMPESFYYPLIGGATSFQNFEADGLPVYIHNRRRCVRPSEMKAFVDARAKLKNPEAVAAGVLAAPRKKRK